ncbi:chalcone isomerase family protein [Simiduia aestuariiviva]|uniref:Chalcone isomerase domain-containing protein n=1 Tax=Simiduia aestuariiviva TaxID=1510459 RepID=A0A839ULZ6_9GAMM|nr:chalcone isomerase family protein [Simiduia aestuariiviva]MBB3167569.1 hypothetical protein [Simiduia aestuariiviva]
MKMLVFLGLLCYSLVALPCETPAGLKAVGAAELRVWGFKIYRASTYSCAGESIVDFRQLPASFTLEILYYRDIDGSDLIEKTRTEWQRLGLYDTRAEQWLTELADIWPNVKANDTLTMWVDSQERAQFLLNKRPIGIVSAEEFAETFAAIWLHPDASYPKLRAQLSGIQP